MWIGRASVLFVLNPLKQSICREGLEGARISCWDFWSYRQQRTWERGTFLEEINSGLFVE